MWSPQLNKQFKAQKGKISNKRLKVRSKSKIFSFGDYCLVAAEFSYLKAEHLQCLKIMLQKRIQKQGKFWIHIKLNKPITKKTLGARLGSGKGIHNHWVIQITRGLPIISLTFENPRSSKAFLTHLSKKLPFRCNIIQRESNLFPNNITLTPYITKSQAHAVTTAISDSSGAFIGSNRGSMHTVNSNNKD